MYKRNITFVLLVFWWYKEDTKTQVVKALSYLNCVAHARKILPFVTKHLKDTWDVLLRFLVCIHPQFYENKAMLPKHGKGFTFQKQWFFFPEKLFFCVFFWNRGFRKALFSPWTRRRNQWDWTAAIQSPGCNGAKPAKNSFTFRLHRQWWQWEKWSNKYTANV